MKILQKGIFILGLLSTCTSLINAAEANSSGQGRPNKGIHGVVLVRKPDGTYTKKNLTDLSEEEFKKFLDQLLKKENPKKTDEK
jgi:hypothetical protein